MPTTSPSADQYVIRRLLPDDYDRGYLQILSELTTVGPLSKSDFASTTFVP